MKKSIKAGKCHHNKNLGVGGVGGAGRGQNSNQEVIDGTQTQNTQSVLFLKLVNFVCSQSALIL